MFFWNIARPELVIWHIYHHGAHQDRLGDIKGADTMIRKKTF